MTDNSIQITIENGEILTDNTNLSLKSSKKTIVQCHKCKTIWTTNKRNLYNNQYSCSKCKKLQDKSKFWFTNTGQYIIKNILKDKQTLPSNKNELVICECATCSMIYTKTIKTLFQYIENNQNPCKKCFPEKGIKTGELFKANYPQLNEKLINEQNNKDFLVATTEKKEFIYGCTHTGHDFPSNFVRNQFYCPNCKKQKHLDKEKRGIENQREELEIECFNCLKKEKISYRNYMINIRKNKNYYCRRCSLVKAKGISFNNIMEKFENIFWSTENSRKPDSLTISSSYRAKLFCSQGHTWESYVYAINGYCPLCSSSSGEEELYQFMIGNNISFIRKERSIISPYELDFYIEDQKIAIEYNGVYWHSESAGKDKNYHYKKWKMCKDKGINLIFVWEDDWINNKNIVENFILHKLKKSKQERFYARKLYVNHVENRVAKEFLNKNHIQGFVSGSYYLGLYDTNDSLLALSVWKKRRENEVELVRYATSAHVIGGLSKLISAFYKENPRYHRIVSFSDNEISNGSMYHKVGFTFDKFIPVDYKYIVNHRRVHKSNYKKSRFKNDDSLLYDSELSESALASLNNISRVWDCGKIRWILDCT